MAVQTRGRGVKIGNDYAATFPKFSDTPKAVVAAIAIAFALRISGTEDEESWDRAAELIAEEWQALYDAGIVPQRPRDRGRLVDRHAYTTEEQAETLRGGS